MTDRAYWIVCVVLAGVAYYVAGMMPPGGAHDGLVAVAGALLAVQVQPRGRGRAIKSAVVAGLVLLAGCGAALPLAKSALQAIAPIAADALRRAAEERGVEIDDGQALCEPLPEEHTPDGMVLVVCVAPEAEE